MSERRFDILFDGSVINGSDPLEVKSKLKALFKLDDASATKLFTGQPIAIKRNIDRKTATQYQTAINKAGAKIQIVLHKPVEDKTAQTPEKESPAAPIKAETSKPVPPLPPASSISQLSLAPSGGDLLKENEKTDVEPIAIKTDHIKLALSQNNPFLETLNKATVDGNAEGTAPRYPTPKVEHAPDLSFIGEEEINKAILDTKQRINALIAKESAQHNATAELSKAGESLLRDDERHINEPIDIDLSHISLAERP